MAKSYSGDPARSSRDAVRFLARDHIDGAMQLQDAEIDWLLTGESNVYMAAAAACEMLAERGLSAKTVGDTSLSYSPTGYKELAATLRKRGASYAAPTWGLTSGREPEDRYFLQDQFNNS